MDDPNPLGELAGLLKGEVLTDTVSRTLYATDASVYKEVPRALVLPRDATDVNMLVKAAARHQLPLIPRGAGTSLAGQVVGKGIVADVSVHMNNILEINAAEGWAEVEPGVVLDDLNRAAGAYGLFFAPETSTSNRCTLGGMVANNSCGAHSMVYGSTRDHLLEVKGCLANGDEVVFRPLQKWEFDKKCRQEDLEGEIYRHLREIYTDRQLRKRLRKEFPHPDIRRRNSGYALDALLDTLPFKEEGALFNLSALIAGSEGTLLFITAIKVALQPLPPPVKLLSCVHFASLQEALEANVVVVREHQAVAVELMDKNVLDLTLDNPTQRQNRFFVEGDPAALLLIEWAGDSEEAVRAQAQVLESDLRQRGMGYTYPQVAGDDIARVWALRKAGLGVLGNMKGDAKPVSLIEDTAVRVEDLPAYVAELDALLTAYGKSCVYHGHAGSGELHIRPVLNLRQSEDVRLFRQIALDTARLVKKYKGSLSGEHGDGRLRGEFIPLMVGAENYALMQRVKQVFDPLGLFNPGKITDTPPMDSGFRYRHTLLQKIKKPVFNWSGEGGLLPAVERCNGSGDCIRGDLMGGTMCPSYRGTREEKHSTRGRANVLRAFLQGQNHDAALSLDDLREVLDLCLSCKACKSECPSGVDMARLKAEFMQMINDKEGIAFGDRLMANLPLVNRVVFPFRRLINPFLNRPWVRQRLQRLAGISPERSLPAYSAERLDHWMHRRGGLIDEYPRGRVMLLADEFTNFYDSDIGIKAVLLLQKLGYGVVLAPLKESGRSQLSKGFVRQAAVIARHNMMKLKGRVQSDLPLVGLEPAALLTFRDEYPDLLPPALRHQALEMGRYAYTIEEFLHREMLAGNIDREAFTRDEREIRIQAHCHQKALMKPGILTAVLSFPENYKASEIQAGCCGMAGSFGYEDRHYHLSMKIGELRLFPAVRATPETTLLAAPGHSCRHQIKDGTQREALHPVEILYQALR